MDTNKHRIWLLTAFFALMLAAGLIAANLEPPHVAAQGPATPIPTGGNGGSRPLRGDVGRFQVRGDEARCQHQGKESGE